MSSSSRQCDTKDCKRSCRAICMCCNQYLCRDHLNEHDDLLNAQVQPLADRVNVLLNRFNTCLTPTPDNLTILDEWRAHAHGAVDEFYERKRQQFIQCEQEVNNRKKEELDKIRICIGQMISEKDVTPEKLNSVIYNIESLEQNANHVQQRQINVTPLIIDDNLISFRSEPEDTNIFSTFTEKYSSTIPTRNQLFPKNSASTSSKSTRWEIIEQSSGFTDQMRIDVLNVTGILVDTYGQAQPEKIAYDIASWLNGTYGKSWNVEIVDYRKYQPRTFSNRMRYLLVQETRLKWVFLMFK